MTQELQLFGLGLQGKSPKVTANKLENCYYEFQAERDRTRIAIYGTPGLELFIDRGDTPWRGLRPFPGNSLLYGVHRGTFYEINNAGVVTSRGTMNTTSGRVDLSDNGTEIAIVDGADGWIYDTGTNAFTQITDGDFPASPNTVDFESGRFLFDNNNTGKFYGSALLDGFTYSALDFATAESQPDNLVRVVNNNGDVILFGDATTEHFGNTGGSGFPYARIGGTVGEYGLAARWSVAKYLGTYAFLAKNREGQVTPAILVGYQYQTISNPELDYLINNYSTVGDASGYSYMLGGHPMYQLNFPTEGKSWLYDSTTSYWSELTSSGGRHRGEISVDYLNNTIISDYSDGKLYKLKQDVYSENGTNIIRKIKGKHIFDAHKKIRIPRLEITGETGVGLVNGQGSDPQLMLQLSKDGGHSLGTEQWRSWGKIGQYDRRAVFGQLGAGRDIVVQLTYAEPTKFVLTGAVWEHIGGLS